MQVLKSSVAGLLVFIPTPHRDNRGYFSRTFDAQIGRLHGIDHGAFIQDSVSRSSRGVVRGLHLRAGDGESKIVRCSYGEIFDVVVDLRPESPTFRQQVSFRLVDHACQSIYIPPGCAHGFQALTDPADITYRIDRLHDPAEDITIAFDDPDLSISWPLPPTQLSDRDRQGQALHAVLSSRLLQP